MPDKGAMSDREQQLREIAIRAADKYNCNRIKVGVTGVIFAALKEADATKPVAGECQHLAATTTFGRLIRCDNCGSVVGEADASATFQSRVNNWTLACFGHEITGDRLERNHRFIEEALELVQALGWHAQRSSATGGLCLQPRSGFSPSRMRRGNDHTRCPRERQRTRFSGLRGNGTRAVWQKIDKIRI